MKKPLTHPRTIVGLAVAAALLLSTPTAFAATTPEPSAPPVSHTAAPSEAPAPEESLVPEETPPAEETAAPAETPAPTETATPEETAAPAETVAPTEQTTQSTPQAVEEKAAPANTVSLAISDISLEGPAIVEVTVTVANTTKSAMRSVDVSFRGPVGWQTAAIKDDLGTIKAGKTATATFQLRVPEKRDGFLMRIFTATATYKGGDGAGSASITQAETTANPLENLAAAFNNVGITAVTATGAGDFDYEGNSFSAEKLSEAGAGQGAELEIQGAALRMPSVAPGTADNVAAAGQAIRIDGETQGERLVFLGAGSNQGATGSVSVFYSDGTVTTGNIGFPNWSFHSETAHGAQLAISTDGRNRPDGFGDAAYQYRLFSHSVALDPTKTVDFVVLPNNTALHLFALGVAP